MDFAEYRSCDATALAQMVREGAIDAGTLLALARARAAEVAPSIGGLAVDDSAYALRQIEEGLPEGPFTGVPFLLKDLYAFLAGTHLTNGSRLVEGFVAPFDSTLVARLKAAGLVIFGKTASPEFGLNVTTEPALNGPARNPWSLAHSAGGSSGGAAAAVAAGIVPMAHASDGGGSIRIPASCCGLVGLKPSRARTPSGPHVGEGWNGLATGFVISRSVRDSALMLDAVAGPEPGDPYACPEPPARFARALESLPGRLRVAVMKQAPAGVPTHADCIEAVDAAARLLEALGHHVEEAAPELNGQELEEAMLTIVGANLPADLDGWSRTMQRPASGETLEPCTLALAERGRSVTGADLVRALQACQRAARAFGRLFTRYDVLLSPTMALPPPELGWLDQSMDDLDLFLDRQTEQIPFTPLYNMTGCPAISLPLHQSGAGLPIGVMFGAPLGADFRLLALAAQLERAAPWFDRVPDL